MKVKAQVNPTWELGENRLQISKTKNQVKMNNQAPRRLPKGTVLPKRKGVYPPSKLNWVYESEKSKTLAQIEISNIEIVRVSQTRNEKW